MGKQLSIYLNEAEAKRLAEIAIRRCRRPHEQARYFLLSALGFTDSDERPALTNDETALAVEGAGGFVGNN